MRDFLDLSLAMSVAGTAAGSDRGRRLNGTVSEPDGQTQLADRRTQSERAIVSTLKHSMTSPARMSW